MFALGAQWAHWRGTPRAEQLAVYLRSGACRNWKTRQWCGKLRFKENEYLGEPYTVFAASGVERFLFWPASKVNTNISSDKQPCCAWSQGRVRLGWAIKVRFSLSSFTWEGFWLTLTWEVKSPFLQRERPSTGLHRATSSVPAVWVLCTVSILVVKCVLNMEDDFS